MISMAKKHPSMMAIRIVLKSGIEKKRKEKSDNEFQKSVLEKQTSHKYFDLYTILQTWTWTYLDSADVVSAIYP